MLVKYEERANVQKRNLDLKCRLGETLILNDGSPTSLALSLIQIDSDNDLGLLILQIRILTLVVRSMNYKLLLNNVIVIDL